MRALVISVVSVVGSIALGAWLEGLGFSNASWLFMCVLCALILTLNFIGAKRLRAYGAKSPMGSTAVAFLICGALGALGWRVYLGRPQNAAQANPPSNSAQTGEHGSEALSPSRVVSLYRLFKEDVPGIKSIDFRPVRLHIQSSAESWGIEPRLHADFVGLSKFVSFYIPSLPAVKDIIRFVADNYSVLTGLDLLELTLTRPGEYPRSTEAIKFTGSIVVYYEDTLSHADLASLEEHYRQRQLTPVWRSTAYVQNAHLAKKEPRGVGTAIEGTGIDASTDR